MRNKKRTPQKILDATLGILKTEGDYGLSMRKVALVAGISLSNVQYHFRSKDDLLRALADEYFRTCLKEIEAIEPIRHDESVDAGVARVLDHVLVQSAEVSEMCCIFREYWAISTRNHAIEVYLHEFYSKLGQILEDILRVAGSSEEDVSMAVSMIVPFAEGYSITLASLPQSPTRVREKFVEVICDVLGA